MDKKKYLVEMRKFASAFPGAGMEPQTFVIWYQDMGLEKISLEEFSRALERIRTTELKWWPGQNLAAMVVKIVNEMRLVAFEKERDSKKALPPAYDPNVAKEEMDRFRAIVEGLDEEMQEGK